MKTDFFAGIDGGGTRTTVICRDADGALVGQNVFGPFNLNGIGKDAFCLLLDQIIVYLKSLGNCLGACIGASGVDNELLVNLAEDSFENAGIRLRLLSDYEIAHTGALDGEEGIIAISGTGSVCFGRTKDGKTMRSGGWGHLIGDDGSAYGLGRDALIAVTKCIDGYGEPTALCSMISDELGLCDQTSIISYVYSNDKRAVANLSPLVERACSLKDPVALKMVEDNAEALVENVISVSRGLGLDGCRLALIGGLFEHGTNFRRCFLNELERRKANLQVTSPLHNAAEGALLEAEKSGC